ncbi:AbfB domain-containing protein [Bacillus thuringiensis]|uniref:AbfB domain-containing protein n=1 Tax=Bacillus thuringiensis TaxID=1428 RepID=UPI003A80168C
MPYLSLESLNYPGRYIRHASYLGELTTIQSELDRYDATFEWSGDWYYGAEGRLRSVNYPLHYLRHQDYRIKLHKADYPYGRLPTPEEQLAILDSTFFIVQGLADVNNQDLISFRSKNFPNRFIRHKDFHLWVEHVENDLDRVDATFKIKRPFVPPLF